MENFLIGSNWGGVFKRAKKMVEYIVKSYVINIQFCIRSFSWLCRIEPHHPKVYSLKSDTHLLGLSCIGYIKYHRCVIETETNTWNYSDFSDLLKSSTL